MTRPPLRAAALAATSLALPILFTATAHGQPSTASPSEPPTPAADAAPAQAPSIGFGIARTLGDVAGPSLRLALGDHVQLEAVVGASADAFDTTTPIDAPSTYRQTDQSAAAAVRVMLPLVRGRDGWLGPVVGVDGFLDRGTVTDGATRRQRWLGAEAGLHGEWFVAPALSLSVEVGGSLVRWPAGTARVAGGIQHDGGEPSTDASVASQAGAGITYWFDAPPTADQPAPSGPTLGVGGRAALSGGPRATLAARLGGWRPELGFGFARRGGVFGAMAPSAVTDVSAGAGALYELLRRGRASLLIGARAEATRTTGPFDPNWAYRLEVPARLELAATPWLSLYTEVAAAATLYDHAHVVRLGGDPVTSAGFTLWL